MTLRLLACLALLLPCAQADLYSYVAAPDSSFAYTITEERELPAGLALNIELTSQTWRGHPWKHWVSVIAPKEPRFPDAAVLVVSGGRNGRGAPNLAGETGLMLSLLSAKLGCTIALLGQVPNQPMFDGLREDALIAHTFDAFLDEGDKDWPLLLPMTKSAVRAMDMLQDLSRTRLDTELQRFSVTGGSKRGWTSWLTAAVDERVIAIAPMVFDTLNLPLQMGHQLTAWGAFSRSIHDYTERGLQTRMQEEARAEELLAMVDPFRHLGRIQQPKYIVLGTNDPYWPVDAARFYFDELCGESYLYYLANAGHGLERAVANSIAAFLTRVMAEKPRPRQAWTVKQGGAALTLSLLCQDRPHTVKLWTARSETRDFRESTWTSVELVDDGSGLFRSEIARPDALGHHVAFYAEAIYANDDGADLHISTRVEVHGLVVD